MALLGNPFLADVPAPFSLEELIQALRIDLTGEYEAIIGYEAHAAATSDTRAKKVLLHIASEERQHVGELSELLCLLSPKDGQDTEKGRQTILTQETQNFQGEMQ